jgi:multisubunit Na+/H+ antiporter MnhG subunit
VWFSFVFLPFLLGLLFGSVYQRLGRTGVYIALGIAFLLLSLFVVVSSYWIWWGAIFGWLAQQTAATFGVWLVSPIVFFALASYALLRKATV